MLLHICVCATVSVRMTLQLHTFSCYVLHKCDRICKNRPPCTHNRNRDSAMNDVIEVWSRSGENLEAIACIVLEIQSLEAQRVG